MQTTSDAFTAYAQGSVRPLSYGLKIAFDKSFDSSVIFFTLDISLLDGIDVLASSDSNVVQEWDKYEYTDYSDRVISLEVTREETEPYSIVQRYADVVVNNYDDFFTPNSGSPIDQYILPRRPARILMGFGGENIPMFVGLSDAIPKIDKNSGIATFHFVDFLTFLFEKSIDQTVMLLDVTTSDVLDYLFQEMGLLPTQYILDETSFNRINFFFVEKGTKLGDIIRPLMAAEQGRLYLDSLGRIMFRNRQHYSTTSVYTFDVSNTINYQVSDENDIINYVKIKCDVLAEQAEQSIWEQVEPVYVPVGGSVDVWVDTSDPITGATEPVYSAEQIESSYFTSTKDKEGEVVYTGIIVSSMDVFANAVKITFENSGSDNGYIKVIDLWGTPVKVIEEIIVEDYDQDSIDALERHDFELETKYIQDRQNAASKAAIIIDDYKDYGSIVEAEVKGNFALQIGDVVTLDLDGYNGDYIITKLYNAIIADKYTQRLRATAKDPRTYFVLSDTGESRSLLNGDDVLSP